MVLGWTLTVSSAGAYYHFLHYTSKTAPFLSVPEKFDLAALPNKTITFFVSSTGPAQFGDNDNFASVLSQMRQATRAWDAVSTSDLRVTFGGLYTDGTLETTPTGEVAFDEEIPPGLLAFTTHTAADQMITRPDGSFFPITRSIIHLKSDLTQRPGPSYTDSFYLTVVHEMGHAMGLQHTFTSSVMSTAVTRATSTLRPLDADDIAAISLLYPRNLAARTGSITGTVTTGKQGVHMASVVALHHNGSAISSLTNPDGTYRIDGIPPGTYFVYVQPLPPTANIYSPLDPDGNPVDPTGPFDGVFYPNTTDVNKATAVTVRTGASADGIDF
ncbi:MAG: peptidase and matrixin and adamalysin, partial [Bryobacterales bacterium]|nr:peptidase and matrixin and adamalysin [Bryobacterales bacterium]